MNNKGNSLIRRYPLTIYFFLAFLFTWLILSPGVAGNLGLIEFNMDGTLLTILSGLGPLIATLIVRSATEGQAGIKETFQAMYKWNVGWKWWATSVVLIPALLGIAFLLSSLVDMPGMEQSSNMAGRGSLVITFLLLILGSTGEESGWRGFALPRLQEKHKPFTATLILTFFWWIWHIPTYWTLPVAIGMREQVGFLMGFGMQSLVLLALGLLCAWVFNGSKGSVLMPILLHAIWNFCSMAVPQQVSTLLLPLFLITAMIVGLGTRGKLGLK
jgi:membrane protease YdiL (CAAX protease family)